MPRKISNATDKTEKKTRSKKTKAEENIPKAEEDIIEEEVVQDTDAVAVPDSSIVPDSSVVPDSSIVPDSSLVPDSSVGDKSTTETLNDSFDEIVKLIDDEIKALGDQPKSKGIKFLKSLNKRIKTLKTKASKLVKKPRGTRKPSTNTNSGFLKPVQISRDMAKFTGWDENEKKSRVEVTKFLCNYITENKLQNPKDRREIFADEKLKKLLKYDPKKDDKLTYYKIQSYIKPHFITAAPVS
jgi:upstream activation factor subunit UAF30